MQKYSGKAGQIVANLLYDATLRRWAGRVCGFAFGAWAIMLVLGIEVLTSTVHFEGAYNLHGPDFAERYSCSYWTGTSIRVQDVSPYGFSACPVWRWGRQVPE